MRKYHHNDEVHLAKMKNRAMQCTCQAEISRIEKEKISELRMLKNEGQRFLKHVSKIYFGADITEKQPQEETSYGLSSKPSRKSLLKDGDADCSGSCVDYEMLHSLLFTDDEFDVEKMLCLHLLSAHRTETLTPPKRQTRYSKYLGKDNSPLERLISRSKRRSILNDTKLIFKLPFYVIEDADYQDEENLPINDGRLASRILLNEKIVQLLNTVLNAFDNSNKEKLHQVFETAMDPLELQKMFKNPRILSFTQNLRNYPIITNCDSFVLTPIFKMKPLNIKLATPSRIVENFVQELRQNVLQLPSRKATKVQNQCSHLQVCQIEEVESFFRKEFDTKPFLMKKNRVSTTESSISKMSGVSSTFKTKSRVFTATDSDKISGSISRETSKITLQTSISDEIGKNNLDTEDLISDNLDDENFHLRHPTCEACMEKWKTPLPSPKTPKLRKNSSYNYLKTNSVSRLSSLISNELYKLASYDRKYSVEYGNFRMLESKNKKLPIKLPTEAINLSNLDLAKINQEIRRKETQKKLENFLNS